MIWRRFISFFRWFGLCIALTAFNAYASDLITDRAYFEDHTGQRDFKDIEGEKFTSYEGVLSRGYTQAAVWIRLEITPPKGVQAGDPLVVLIKPVYLDEITLFDPLDVRTQPRVVGDRTAFSKEEIQSLNHTFVVPAGNGARHIWLKVRTTSTALIYVASLTQLEMIQEEFQTQLFSFAVIAVTGMFLLQVMINWINHHESLYALFVARQFYFFIYTSSLFGLHRYLLQDYLTPGQLDVMYNWIVVGATGLVMFFERAFLTEYLPNKAGRLGLAGLVIWSVVVWCTLLLGHTQLALHLNMLLNALGPVTLLCVVAFCIDSKKIKPETAAKLLDRKVVISYYLLLNSIIVSSVLPFLGVMQGSMHTVVNGLVYYTLFSGVPMTILMQIRTNKLAKAHREYEHKLSLSLQQAQLEKIRREEQAHLMHMLMHELKNPLAIIEMAHYADNDAQTTADYISRAVKNMKDVIDRCVRADKLSEGNVDIHCMQVDLGDVIEDCLASRDHDEHEITLLLGDDLHVRTDIQFVQIMLNNLLDNAHHYGDPHQAIALSAYKACNAEGVHGVAITVSNRPGLASWPDAGRVFTKYYRSEAAKSKSGTGLGLYLVRTLARLVGGDCRYLPDSQRIKFELWLPS